MELRPSDIWLQASKVLSDTGQTVGQIGASIYEADRVTQVNQGLAYYERVFQNYQKDLANRTFEVSKDTPEVEDVGGAPAADWSGTTQVTLGQATQADLDADYSKFVNSQVEYVQKTFRNRSARNELLQHLQMGAIANRGKALQTWNVAADHEATASLNNLYGVVMASDEAPDEKVRKISVRVDEMVRTGRMWKDTGEALKSKAQDTARYSFSYNGAMAVLKETGDQDQAEAWLIKNTPFYEGNPDARSKVFDAVREQYGLMEAKDLKVVKAKLSLKNTDYLTRFATLTESEVLQDAYLRSEGRRGEVSAFTEKWVNAIRQLGRASDSDKVVATLEQSLLIEGIYGNRQFDNIMVGDQISDLVERGKLPAAVAKKYVYDRMDNRKWIIHPQVSSAIDAMLGVYDRRIAQEKDPEDQGALVRQRSEGLDEFHRFLAEGEHTHAEVISMAKRIGDKEVARAMNADAWSAEGKTSVDARRTRALAGEGYTTDERSTYEYNDRKLLEREWGVGKKPGTAILETSFDSSGMAQYRIAGLNPKKPNSSFWYRFETNPTTGTEQLVIADIQVNADGTIRSERWVPSGILSTKEIETANELAARNVEQADKEATLAAGAAPARKAAAAAAALPTVEQKAKLDDFLRAARGGVSAAEIAAAAKNIAVTKEWLIEQVIARGISVSGLEGVSARGLLGDR